MHWHLRKFSMTKYLLPFFFSVIVEISPFGIISHPILDELAYREHTTIDFIGSPVIISPTTGRIKIIELNSECTLCFNKKGISISNLDSSSITISLLSNYDTIFVATDDIVEQGDTIALLNLQRDSSYNVSLKVEHSGTLLDPAMYFPAVDYETYIFSKG